MKYIDPSKNGIIIVGPYRGLNKNLVKFNNSLKEIQNLSGWPVFADPLSGGKFRFKRSYR